MKKQILLALFFSFTYLGLNAQCNVPFPPSLTCASAPVICTLDGYCTTSGGANSADQPSTFCGSVQNNQWFSFVAGSANITLDFIVGLCGGTTSGTGLQAQVYSMCGAPWTSASNCLYEISPGSTETLTMTGLTIGNVYYLMTDGFSGDMCDYTIEVTSGSTTPPTPDPAGPISGDPQFCPGASSVTYCAAPSLYAAFYEWTIPAGATIVGADDGACITIDFGGMVGTTGVITATPTNGCESGGPSTFNVSQGPAPTTPDVDFNLCPGDSELYGNTMYSTAGTFLNMDIANAQGCLIETYINVMVGQDMTTDLMEVICVGESSTTGETSSGAYTYNLFTSLGCDSTVTLNLTVLNPQTGIFPVTGEIDCSGDPVQIGAVVTDTDPSISYIWTGPCVTQNLPGQPNIEVSCGGVYTVYAEQTVNGVTCVSPSSSVTVIENTTPPNADPGLGGVIDCGGAAFTLGGSGSSNTSTYSYSWTGPNGFSSAMQFPSITEPGNYCFFLIDNATLCVSATVCVTVTGDNTPPVVVAAASNNLDCNATTATLDPTGSDPGTYTWSGQTGSNPTVSSPGTYTLTVTSANGCTATQEVTITQDSATPTASITPPAGIDCNNSSVSLDGNGSSSGVTYLWSTGDVTATTTTNMGAGTYTLTVTNTSNGCTDEVSVVVGDNSTIVTAQVDVQGQINCTTGSVTLSAININGTSNPSYLWMPGGQTTSTITVSSAGSVTLTVTDINTGCSGDVMATVTSDNNTPMAVAGVSGDLSCTNTSVVLSSTGSTTGGNITASWSATDPNNVTTPGMYTLTITNTDNGCTATADINVIQDIDAPIAAVTASNNLDCNATTATLDPSGSDPGTYTWAGPGNPTGSNPTVNMPGTYTLTVSNTNGCTATQEVTITEDNATPTASISSPAGIDCDNSSVSLDGGGSSSGVTYLWSTGETTATTTTNMGAGTYTLTVTNTSNGCTDEVSVVVSDNSTVVTAEVDVQGQINCTSGSVTLSAINITGSSNPSYLWMPGGQTTPTITVSSAGSVTLTVTDINTGCNGDAMADVTSDNNTPMAVAAVSGDLNCTNTSVVLSTAGSTTGGNITASWSATDPNNVTTPGMYTLTITNTDNGCTATADVNVIQDVDTPVAAIAVPTAIDCNNMSTTLDGSGSTGANLNYAWTGQGTGASSTLNATMAGTYTLTITNMDNGCTDTEEITVVDNTTIVTVQATVSNELTCTQVSATLDVSGGSGSSNPIYTWTGPETGSGSTLSVSTPGTYTVTNIDGNTGCEGSFSITVLEDASGPTSSVAPANDLTCSVPSVTLDGTASTTGNNITYQWFITNGGATTPVAPGNTEIIDVTVAGDYTLIVTDIDNGCTTISSVVPVILDDAAPTASAVAGNNGVLSCSSSSLTIDGSSSTGNCLIYEWSNNGSVVGTGSTLEVSNQGDYILVVTNCDNGCTNETLVNVAADAGLPNAGIDPVVNLDCANSTSTLQGTGSSNTGGTVSVEWFFGGNSVGVNPDYTTMMPGEYTFVVTDAGNGCSSSAIVQLSENTDPPAIDIDPTTIPVIDCANTMVTVNATNSASGANISYQWQDAGGIDLPLEINNTLMTSDAGDYIFVVTNTDNGCTSTQTVTVPENIQAPVIDASALNNIDCNNMEATLQSSVTSSFSTDLTISWVLNGTTIGIDPSITTSNPGTVTVTYVDNQNGCSTSMDIDVDNTTSTPDVIVAASNNAALNCTTTELVLDGTGSSTGANVTYSWYLDSVLITGATDIMYTADIPGNYTLTVTNSDNGCTSTTPIAVTESIAPPSSIATSNTATLTCTDPTITLDGTSSSIGANFTYQWFEVVGGISTAIPAATDISYDAGVAGTYELVVTNTDNGCTAISTQLAIDQSSDVPMAVISSDGILTCENGMVMVDGLSSTSGGPLSYEWIDIATGLPLGTDATLEVTTSIEVVLNIVDQNNGCTSTTSFLIDEDVDAPAIIVNPGSTLNCIQTEYDLDGSGSTLDPNVVYTFEWTAALDPTFSETTLTVSNIGTPDTYTLLITNTETGCTASEQVVVDGDFGAPTVSTSNNFTITCGDDIAPLEGTGSSANGNFTYQWLQGTTPFSTMLDTVTTQTGSYTLIVTNEDNGCSSISNAIVIDIDADLPTVLVAPAPMITCNDNGEIILDGSASDTGADIEYQWFLNGVEVTGATNAFLTTTDPGNYIFQVNNVASGCTDQVSFTVDADQAPPVAQAGAGGTLICGQLSYELDAVAAGSSDGADFTYIWYDAAGNQVGTGPVFAATAPGDFSVEVTNMVNGCVATSNATQVVADSNSPILLMDPSADGLTCDIETITYDATTSTVNPNSSGTLVYEWTDASGVIGNTPMITVSNTNPVTLTITDNANNCSVSASYTAPQNIEQPTANAGPEQTLLCGTPNVTLDGSGSSANGASFTYEWTDPNNDPTGTTATITATISGTYTLLITNTENGCTSTSTVEVDQDINVPTAVVDFSGMLTCVDTELPVDASNSTIQSPTGTIEYLWENGSNMATTTWDAPGTYTVLITDTGNGCTAEQSFTIEEDVLAPVADFQALTSTTISCTEPNLLFNGSASNNNNNPNGGTLTYLWTLDNIPVTGGTSDQVEISEPGDLVLEVTNTNNGCTSTFLMNVDVSDDVPDVNIPNTPQPLTCIIDEATIVANDVSLNSTDNTYLWTGPGTIVGETTLTPTVSATGTYTLTVTNAVSGCEISITSLVEGEFDTPNAFANATDQFDCITDEVTLDGIGSTTGTTISYSWTTATGVFESGQNTFNPVVSAPGDYTLIVTDNVNGCTSSATVTVSANSDVPTIAGLQVIDPNCFGENNGSITLSDVTGGQLPYLYSIDGGALAPINQFSFLSAGEYEIVVQDANGCETNQVITITDPQELLVELGDNQTIGLGDEFQLSAQIVGAYDTIMWSANCPDSICADQPEFSVSPLNTISYFVTVVDGNGCITTDQITLNVEKGREVFIPNAFTPNGDGNNDHFRVYPGDEVAKIHEFRVFNRWGEQVFGVSNYDPFDLSDEYGWDGTLGSKRMNPAVFVYYLDIEYIDGRREVLKGDVALRR